MRCVALDFDGTLCSDEAFGPPDPGALRMAREHFDARHMVVVYTARPEDDRAKVEAWLREHDVRYDALRMGKLRYDLLVDDRALNWPGMLPLVGAFNDAAGGPTTWEAGAKLRLALVEEETQELLAAMRDALNAPCPSEHVFKEALDVLYVVLGIFMLASWDDRELFLRFRHLHASNMERFEKGVKLDANGKAVRH